MPYRFVSLLKIQNQIINMILIEVYHTYFKGLGKFFFIKHFNNLIFFFFKYFAQLTFLSNFQQRLFFLLPFVRQTHHCEGIFDTPRDVVSKLKTLQFFFLLHTPTYYWCAKSIKQSRFMQKVLDSHFSKILYFDKKSSQFVIYEFKPRYILKAKQIHFVLLKS